MIKHTTVLCMLLAVALAVVLFLVKHEVQRLETELSRLDQEIIDERRAIHLLGAEWSHLTDPERLARLATRHLNLRPIGPEQVGGFSDLPWRPARDADEGAAAAPATARPPQ